MPDTPRSQSTRLHGIVLAFDYGVRRIGVAAGNSVTRSATALTTVHARSGRLPWTDIDRLVEEWSPDLLVVGQPDLKRGSTVARQASEFSKRLTERYQLPVKRVDETLTSAAAQAQLRDARRAGQRRRPIKKDLIDSHAARLIAEQFLSCP